VTNYTMSEELVLVALRVLACSVVRRQDPTPEDVARLREAVTAEERDWEAETLAAYITERELRHRRRTRLAAAASAACGR
jgi:primosomal protein N''